ncbi:MAG: response regulator [Patescibacteria group bacterium]|nr:response regulator [Patescibacteria group bacterium]
MIKEIVDNKDKPRILLLEDYPDLIEYYFAKLTEAGFAVDVESDEDHGLSQVLKDKPDLVILDISLPKADDFGFIREMKKHPEIAGVPVLILTDLADEKDVEAGLKAGASVYLVRDDFAFAQVIDKIKEVIEKVRSKK